MALTEAQKRAKKKYYEKNKEKENLQASMRASRYFINKTDSIEKLEELKKMIIEKIEILKNNGGIKMKKELFNK